MLFFKVKVYKQAKKIAKKGGASPKNKLLIKIILDFLENRDMKPEDLEREIKEGKGKKIFSILGVRNRLNNFLDNLMEEVKKEYYKNNKKKGRYVLS